MSLRREIGPLSAVLITVGATIGSGIFATPHDVAGLVSDPALTLALWVVGGALALLGCVSFAELGAALPEAGGLYVYLRRAFGPVAAFVFAWAMLAVLIPSSMGYFAQVTARHAVAIADGPRSLDVPVSLGVLFLVVIANLGDVRAAAGVQDVATVVKFVGIFVLALMGLFALPATAAPLPFALPGVAALLAALVPVLWAYDGWIDVTTVAGELRNPARDVPRSLALGTAAVTALYLLANAAYLRVLGPAALAASETPAVDAAARAAGTAGRVAVTLLVAVSTFGGCVVALLTGSRVVYAVAHDGLFWPTFARTTRAGAPAAAVLYCGVIAAAYVASPLGHLGEVFVVGSWPFYAAGALACVVLRHKEPLLPRPHRTVGYPYTIALFVAASMAVVLGYAFTRPLHTVISLGVVALGVPLFMIARRAQRRVDRDPSSK